MNANTLVWASFPRTGRPAGLPASPKPKPLLRPKRCYAFRSACSEGSDGLDVSGALAPGAGVEDGEGSPSPVATGTRPATRNHKNPKRGCGCLALAAPRAPPGTQLAFPLRGLAGGSMSPAPLCSGLVGWSARGFLSSQFQTHVVSEVWPLVP